MILKFYWQNIKDQLRKMKNKIYFGIFFLMLSTSQLSGQCAMCKAAVEANLKDGGSAGAGLNQGILYLMAMPYVAMLIFGVIYYIQRSKRQTL